jgi:hypothetical protein
MNNENRNELKAVIPNDLIQVQSRHFPKIEFLRQDARLYGIVTKSAPHIQPEAACAAPVENSLAPHATVAPNDSSPWHGATVAQDATVASGATVARYAEVKGELRVPNTINFSLFPTLDPFAKAVYYQLFLLSHGFRRDRCIVGLAKLANMVLMSLRKVQDTVVYLEKRGLIRRLGSALGGTSKGNVYQVMLPPADTAPCATVAQSATLAGDATLALRATLAPETTVARHATNKDDDDDKNKRKSSSKGQTVTGDSAPVENHRCTAAPRERKENANGGFVLVRTAYEKATGNRWNKSDSEAYDENGIEKVPGRQSYFGC